MYCDWGYLTWRDHSSDKIRFPEKALTHLECFLLLSTILSNAHCEAWQALCGLLAQGCLGSCSRTPWPLLIRRRKWLCLRKQGRLSTLSHYPVFSLTLTQFSQSVTLFSLTEESTLCHMLFFLQSQWCGVGL